MKDNEPVVNDRMDRAIVFKESCHVSAASYNTPPPPNPLPFRLGFRRCLLWAQCTVDLVVCVAVLADRTVQFRILIELFRFFVVDISLPSNYSVVGIPVSPAIRKELETPAFRKTCSYHNI